MSYRIYSALSPYSGNYWSLTLMELLPFLLKFCHKDHDLNKLVFSNHTHEYGGNPKLAIVGSVLFDEEQNVFSIEASLTFQLISSMGQNGVCFDLKVKIDVEKLIGFDSHQYIYATALSLQESIINMLIKGNDIDLFDSEVDNLETWNRKYFLHQPPDLEAEFNITWIAYWVATRLRDSLNTWKNLLAK